MAVRKQTEQPVTALEKTTPGGLEAIPDFITKGDVRGTEGLNREDVRIPRVVIAQPTSTQIKPSDPTYIQDLRMGEIFNDLSGEVYGSEPITVVVVRKDPPHYVEFDPDKLGVVIDGNVPPGDPRTQFTEDDKGNRVVPLATKFYDYVVLKLPEMAPMALSFKSTSIKTALKLNGLIKMKPVPIFAQRYVLGVTEQKNDQGSWYAWTLRQAGFVDKDTYLVAEEAYEAFKDRAVDFERAPVVDAESVVDKDGKVPF